MEGTLITISVVILLLVLNGFFVAAEFALVKAKQFRIDARAEGGSSGARMTQRMQGADLEAYLAACQLGITMASLGLGWVGEPAVAAVLEPMFEAMGMPEALLHTVAFLIGFIIFSSLHIVIGEQVPKTFAIRKAEPVAVWCAYPLRAFYILMFPLNWLLNWASRAILSSFGVDEATHADVLTDDELRGLISLSKEHGSMSEKKAAMFSNLFAFDERMVGRVMIPGKDVKFLDLSAPPEESARILRETQHSRFPVLRAATENPFGILLSKDLYVAMLSGDATPWQHLEDFCRDALVVPENLRIAKLFETMRSERAHMTFVVDEYGDFVGLVTLEDLLEEIVGDIADETDTAEVEYFCRETKGGWEAHGLAPLADVQRATGLVVPTDLDANTLSGLFMQRLGRMPEEGDAIEESGFRLEVRAMKEYRVEQAYIEQLSETASTSDTPAPPAPPSDEESKS